MNEFDPKQMKQYLEEITSNVAIQAEMDQRHAEMMRLRSEGTWWAALASLADIRDNQVANAIAVQQLKRSLAEVDFHDLVILATYLLHNTLYMAARYEHDDDVEAVIADVVGAEGMLNFEKFVATDGMSCPNCGADLNDSDHECPEHEHTLECLEDGDGPVAG